MENDIKMGKRGFKIGWGDGNILNCVRQGNLPNRYGFFRRESSGKIVNSVSQVKP